MDMSEETKKFQTPSPSGGGLNSPEMRWGALLCVKPIPLSLGWISVTVKAVMIAGKPLPDVNRFGAVAIFPLAFVLGFRAGLA